LIINKGSGIKRGTVKFTIKPKKFGLISLKDSEDQNSLVHASNVVAKN